MTSYSRRSLLAVVLLAALPFVSCGRATTSTTPSDAASAIASVDRRDAAANRTDIAVAAQDARRSFAKDAAPSLDALINDFVTALTSKDTAMLDRLRVTKIEYSDLIVPGTVPPSQPPRAVSAQPREYFWSTLDTKSRYFTENLLEQFGGRPYARYELSLTRQIKEYAWYTARGQVKLELYGTDGATYHLLTGWVAEVDGRYKFIGYNSES